MKIKLFGIGLTVLCVAVLIAGCVPSESAPDASTATVPPVDPTPVLPTTPPTPTPPQPTVAAPLDSPTAQPTTPPEEADSPPAPTAEPDEPTALAPQAAKDCADTAAFFGDVTIPDGTAFKQNEPFVKTWRVRNEGTCTWGPDYALVFSGGDPMNGALTNPMSIAAPGAVVDVSVNLTAPASGGAFTGLWEFQDPQGQRFGVGSGGTDPIWVKIGVSIYDESGSVKAVGAQPASGTPTDTCSPQRDSGYEQDILEKINSARAAQGLTVLKLDDRLSAAAYAHSTDMACQDFIDHAGSDGSTWYTRIQAQDYTYAYATENIYVGNPAFGGTPDGAFDWWMNSPVHRDNILSAKVSEIGIGYAYSESSTYGGYYTLNFARP